MPSTAGNDTANLDDTAENAGEKTASNNLVEAIAAMEDGVEGVDDPMAQPPPFQILPAAQHSAVRPPRYMDESLEDYE